MSPISFFQRHPRADLSAYLDGELTPAAALRLEAHIASCAACAAQLGELRETRSALRSIPDEAAPRSFALTPEMARDARPVRQALPAGRVQPLVNGLRLASGGLAVALAVVVVIGVSGGGSNSSNDSGLASLRENGSTEQYSADVPMTSNDLNQSEGSGDDAGATSTPAPTLSTTDDDVLVPGSTLGSVGGSAGVGGDGAPATDIAKAVSGEFDSATPVPEAAGLALDSAEDAGGVGMLTIVAIVLGVLLAAAFIGSIAASRLARKTP